MAQLSDNGNQLAARPTPNASNAPGWVNNDRTQTTAPTISDPDMANALMGEVANLAASTGQALSKTDVGQALRSVNRIAGGYVTTLTATSGGITPTLTVDNAGLVVIDATLGNVAVTLPEAAAAAGQSVPPAGSSTWGTTVTPFAFRFIRIDASANTVTFALSGSDGTEPTGGLPALAGLGATLVAHSDGISKWCVEAVSQPHGVEAFTANGTFTVPAQVTTVDVEVWGAGGGGSGTTSGSCATSGGGGGYARKRITGLTPGATVAVTVGAGGAAGAANSGAVGTGGGTSSFGSYASATGGSGAQAVGTGGGAVAGGAGSGGDVNATGGGGSAGSGNTTGIGGVGGAGAMGGGGGSASQGAYNGGAGGFPGGGGGGGGAGTTNTSGAGANGLVVVRW